MCQEIEEMIQDSRKEGRKEGILEILFGLVKEGILTITDAAKRTGMDVHDFEKTYKTFLM